MTTAPTDLDGWKSALKGAAGTIVGVEDTHPDNLALKKAAQPFLDYVAGLDLTTAQPDE